MTASLKQRYLAHYVPLICEFVREVEQLPLDIKPKTTQPFFPLFGEGYERSALRMAIVGQDTRGWGCLNHFLEIEKREPGSALEADLQEFQNLDFKDWGTTRYTFWGFAMMFLAALHGRSDWGIMKRGACKEILASFAWGNGNAVEYYGSSEQNMSGEQWEKIRKAGERFNGISHLIRTLSPRVVVVLWKDMDPQSYFAGYTWTQVDDRDGIRAYRIEAENVDIFHVPHPGRMRWEGIPADHYCAHLVKRLQEMELAPQFPAFVQQDENSRSTTSHLTKSAPPRSDSFDKFQFVEWVAEELSKQGSFMSAPCLTHLLNEGGYTTDYGEQYSGASWARGIYNVISGTYQRLESAGKRDRAEMVAAAFRKPNFEYAYHVS